MKGGERIMPPKCSKRLSNVRFEELFTLGEIPEEVKKAPSPDSTYEDGFEAGARCVIKELNRIKSQYLANAIENATLYGKTDFKLIGKLHPLASEEITLRKEKE